MNNECNQLIRVTAGKESLLSHFDLYFIGGIHLYLFDIEESNTWNYLWLERWNLHLFPIPFILLTYCIKNDNTHLKSLTHVFPSNGYITQNSSMHERSRIQKPIDKQIRAEWWNTCTKRKKSFYNIYILSIRHKGHVYTHVTNLNWEKSHGKTHIWNSFPYRPMNSLLKF